MSKGNYSEDMFKNLSQSLGQSPDTIKNSAQQGNMDALLKNLSPQQREKVNNMLNNPEATKKILENPKVQALIKKLQNNG